MFLDSELLALEAQGGLQIATDVAVNLMAVFIVFVARLLGFDTYSRLIRTARRVPILCSRLTGRRTVLVYTDCDDESHTTRSLAERLTRELDSSCGMRVKARTMRDGVDLLRWPYPKRNVLGVIVLITDVTQLGTRPNDRRRLQRNLSKYVRAGGRLILGHDVIYRRSRNDELQKLAGGTLDKFQRTTQPIRYVKVEAGDRVTNSSGLLAELPDELELRDGEVVIGDWAADVEYLYRWERSKDVPLVTRRAVERGHIYWVNSGDSSTQGPPRSIARPEDQFVSLMSILLTH